MAKNDVLDEKDDTNDPAFQGNSDGRPAVEKTQSGQGQGAGAVTRLRSGPSGQYRTATSDNPGAAPFTDGGNKARGTTNQDAYGDAALYDEKSNSGGNENLESAGNEDVGDYYKDLSARVEPNYDKLPSLQVKQRGLDLPPVEGESGFVGGAVGATPGFSVIMGKKGFTQDQPVWDQRSSHTEYPDNSGSVDQGPSQIPHSEEDRDEFAKWKLTVSQSDNMAPQTSHTFRDLGGAPIGNFRARDEGGGNPDTQSIPDQSSGDSDTSDMPQTEFTHQYGAGHGTPAFKKASPQNKDGADNLYRPKPVQ